LLEVDDVVLREYLQVLVNGLDVPVETGSQLADALRLIGHDAPKKFDTAVREQGSEVARILEVDDVRDLLSCFPSFQSVECVLSMVCR
jgi:hypothetical protein